MHARILFALFAAIFLLAALGATAARADYLKGDPRVCTLGNPATCAKLAARWTTLDYTKRHPGTPKGMVICHRVNGSLLLWDCSIIAGGVKAVARVSFRATSTGWKRYVTVTTKA